MTTTTGDATSSGGVATTGSGDATTTRGDPTESGSSTGEGTSDTGQYRVEFTATAFDRIRVRRQDVAGDVCVTVVFVFQDGGSPSGLMVDLPGLWGVESAGIREGAALCLEDQAVPGDTAQAGPETMGTAAWTPEVGCPATIDLDMTLVFAAQAPWVPAAVVLDRTGLPVEGC